MKSGRSVLMLQTSRTQALADAVWALKELTSALSAPKTTPDASENKKSRWIAVSLANSLPDFLPHRPLGLLSSLLRQNCGKIELSSAAGDINLRDFSNLCLPDDLEYNVTDNDDRCRQVSFEKALDLLSGGHAPVANWEGACPELRHEDQAVENKAAPGSDDPSLRSEGKLV